MTALQGDQTPQPPRSPGDRTRDVFIGILISIIVGLVAGIIHQSADEKATFFDALQTGCTAGGWTAVFVVAVLVYVWSGQ